MKAFASESAARISEAIKSNEKPGRGGPEAPEVTVIVPAFNEAVTGDELLLRAMNLECERFVFCAKVTAKACRMGLVICEVPIGYNPRGAKQGKKIRWTDGVLAVATLWRYRRWRPRRAFASCDSESRCFSLIGDRIS